MPSLAIFIAKNQGLSAFSGNNFWQSNFLARIMKLISLGKLYGFLLLFFTASEFVTEMNAIALGLAITALAIPSQLALWHQGIVKRLLNVTQFQPSRSLHWLASRRLLGIVLAVLISLTLTGFVLIQSVLFENIDWVLLFFAPVTYLGYRIIIERATQAQFTSHVYAIHWAHQITRWTLLGTFALLWIALSYYVTQANEKSLQLAEAVHQLQAQWANAPSGITRWMLDMGAWGKASVHLVDELPDAAKWKLMITAFIAPVTVFGYLGLSCNGLSFGSQDLRRIFGRDVNATDTPEPIGNKGIALWIAMVATSVLTLLYGLSSVDQHLHGTKSVFALEAVPECEKIGAGVYKVNTIDSIATLWKETDLKLAAQHTSACSSLKGVREMVEPGVEKYLDWYFSLGAELSRVAATFTGSTDEVLSQKFDELIMSDANLRTAMRSITNQPETDSALITSTQERVHAILKSNLIVLSEAQCKVMKLSPATLITERFSHHTERITASATAGLLVGAFAAKATAKALGKASMKSASKVLVKAIGKAGVSKGGAMVAGAALGATAGSMIPILGTVAGAIGGGVMALGAAVTFDFGALLLEEKLTRDQMKNDLLDAVHETTLPARQVLGCHI